MKDSDQLRRLLGIIRDTLGSKTWADEIALLERTADALDANLKVFVFTGEYAEDGTYIVAANTPDEARDLIKKECSDWEHWFKDFGFDEIEGMVVHGTPRILWN